MSRFVEQTDNIHEMQLPHFQDVFVDKEFDARHKEMLETRPDLKVTHNGILSNYVLKGPPPRPHSEVTAATSPQGQTPAPEVTA